MFDPARDQDTICALATAAGRSAISVIRLSGPRSAEISRKIFPAIPSQLSTHKAILARAVDPASNETVDETVLTYFEKGRSFTSEEACEIACHGNPTIISELLRLLVESGARIAEPGEFTYRAFMNGRIDLVQAESVLSLIESRSKAAARLAVRQLSGELSRRIRGVVENVLWALSRSELSIDFSTEDVEVVGASELSSRIGLAAETLKDLLASYEKGRKISSGLEIALMGRPNAGKSSLFNSFIGSERAIVTEIAGTTRDSIREETSEGGIVLRFVDTAGLRETSDVVEKIGVERSIESAAGADVQLFVIDGSQGFLEADQLALARLDPFRVVLLANKSDLITADQKQSLETVLRQGTGIDQIFLVSAKMGEGINLVKKEILRRSGLDLSEGEAAPVIQARQYELLRKASEAVVRGLEISMLSSAHEFISVELQTALKALYEITGEQVDDQVLDRVFKDFCIGK